MRCDKAHLAVVVAVRVLDDPAPLQRCFESLIAARQATSAWGSIEIIIVDDASTFDLKLLLTSSKLTKLSILKNEGRPGQAGALNFALATVAADVYAFTDSDCIVAPDWLEVQARRYSTHPCPGGLVGPNWLHLVGPTYWSRWLTRQESRLCETILRQYVQRDGRVTRFDCRNFSISRSYLDSFGAPDIPFFLQDLGPSVSGRTSAHWRGRFASGLVGLTFVDSMRTRHNYVSSLIYEVRRYYRWGLNGGYSTIYSQGHRSLLSGFIHAHFLRHFFTPAVRGRVSPLYLWAVHGAYWLGILLGRDRNEPQQSR